MGCGASQEKVQTRSLQGTPHSEVITPSDPAALVQTLPPNITGLHTEGSPVPGPSYAETGPLANEVSNNKPVVKQEAIEQGQTHGETEHDKTLVVRGGIAKKAQKDTGCEVFQLSQGKEKEMSSQIEAQFPELRTLIANMRKHVSSLETARSDSGIKGNQYWQTLQALNRLVSSAQDINTPEKKKAVGVFLAEIGMVLMLTEDLKTIKCNHQRDRDFINANWKSIYYNLLVNINYTDSLPTYARALVDNGLLDVYEYFMTDLDMSHGTNETYMIKVAAETIVNISRAVTIHVLRASGIVTALIPLVRSADQSIAIASLIALASIVDEEQNNLLMASSEPIRLIIALLKKALSCPNHRLVEGTQWAAYELADGLSQIASNDSNKVMIVSLDGLPVIVDFLENAANVQEQESAARCIWMLAFNKDNVTKIKEYKTCLNLLRSLKNSSDNNVARAASGALWEIEQKEIRGEERLRQSQMNVRESDDAQKPHIMISYQWDVQNTLIKVKNRLQQCGFRVWMDIEQMQGSTLEEMARAVENAAIVLMCVSSKYKDSPNCRTEAEYAFQLKKDIVPLMMEPNFQPDGWLGMILGSKFWYDFREKTKGKESLEKLSGDLRERAGQAHSRFQGTVEATKAVESSADTGIDIMKWTSKDVVDWVNGLGIKNISTTCFSQFNGELLLELQKLREEAPDFYYTSLKTELGISRLLDVLKFNRALASLM